MKMKQTVAIVTPVKNEIENLPLLIETIEKQTHPIALWVIIDDNSNDGSGEYLEQRAPEIKNVGDIKIFHLTTLINQYMLGPKYSQVLSYGFEKIIDFEKNNNMLFDFIGILDADCFVQDNYYQILVNKFKKLPRLGIASGVIHYNLNNSLVFDKLPLRWARGGVRIWRADCFRKSGYMIGYSADAVSSALAWTSGWHSQAFPDTFAVTRELGQKFNYAYYGESCYYRYVPFYYVFLKSFIIMGREGLQTAKSFLKGYLAARVKRDRIIVNEKVRWYFRLQLIRNIYEYFIAKKNIRIAQ